MADAVAKASGRPIAAFGQARAAGRLWLWLDFGQMMPGSAETLGSSPFGYLRGLVDATRAWSFVTSAGGQQYMVWFYVSRISNVSVDELNRLIDLAGPVFARILDSLTLEAP
jgi:hypothetical protein